MIQYITTHVAIIDRHDQHIEREKEKKCNNVRRVTTRNAPDSLRCKPLHSRLRFFDSGSNQLHDTL